MPCWRSCKSEKRAVVSALFLCHPQNTLLVYLFKCYLSSLYLSEHCFVECSLTIPAPCTTIKETCFRKWKNIDLDVFKNDISNQTFTVLLMKLSPIFMQMINFSLTSGIVQSIWKSALVVSLLKQSGLELTFNNFRPVSNLSLISKLGEKIVVSQILGHCRALPLYLHISQPTANIILLRPLF